ncbi:unnamed protein product [Brassicogethes aeneus]|uniref:Chorein N-terminal domain-containing protein n=1 Tax=Brassicogethes aeneus TaxID=1431903 RepID=A0A9P0BDK1_BRAAE|nr:unnamed protein product [Brassicogethes aeneus]
MLEGAVARILNQILEKYVTDIDFGNLNVGIFSGQVQLTDLKIKPEALYELQLPIEVTAGTIGKIWLKIPWTALWQEQIVISIEDVLIVSEPVVNGHEFDAEINKTLLRAMKKKLLDDVHLLGGPSSFAQHLITNLLNRLQLTVSNADPKSENSHYLVKLDALSTYWNHDAKLGKWNLPSDYYAWKNAMSLSLQSYKMNDEEFDFGKQN